jgi:ADP-ribose pyrophosphatase YjhB (NUDIX family)
MRFTAKIRCRGIILLDEKMLTVAHSGKEDRLVLPGGHWEGEEGFKETLERELIEELGVKPEIGPLLYVHTYESKEGEKSVEFIFLVLNGADYLDLSEKERTHAYELAGTEWVSKDCDKSFRPETIWQDFKNDTLPAGEVRFI